MVWSELGQCYNWVDKLQTLKDNVDVRDRNGRTTLMCKVLEGEVKDVEQLLEWNASVRLHDNHGRTPLHSAVYALYYRRTMVKMMLEAGADVDAVDKNGNTALMYAAREHDVPHSLLNRLLQYSSDVNASNAKGETALYFAACDGSPYTVRALLEKGADVGALTNEGGSVQDIIGDENQEKKALIHRAVQLQTENLQRCWEIVQHHVV